VDSGQGGGFYLQLDIHNFFNSIHRPTLWGMLKTRMEKRGAPMVVMQATHALLRHPPLHAGVKMHGTEAEHNLVPQHKRLVNAGPGRGLPIGNLSSQFFANVYPLQFDIVDRLIERYSNPDEEVYDPFGGLMTVPYRAILLGRRGRSSELNSGYFMDGVHYLRAAEREHAMPSLFDFDKGEEAA
jgi:hypothetical protein